MSTDTITREDDEGREWEIELSGSPYRPDNFSGHPDRWTPAEGGLEEVTAVCVGPEGDPMVGTELDWDGVNTHFGAGTVRRWEQEVDERAAEAAAEARAEARADDREWDRRYGRD